MLGKHHQAYVNKLNSIAESDPEVGKKSIEELVKTTSGVTFNQAAQVFNHDFYWYSLKPNGGGAPTGKVAELINRDFGSFDSFKAKFNENCVAHFGSGWVWLVKNENGKLEIVQTHDADCPIRHKKIPLITCDVWEHAYYIDKRNNRAGYVDNFWNLVNWEFANKNLEN